MLDPLSFRAQQKLKKKIQKIRRERGFDVHTWTKLARAKNLIFLTVNRNTAIIVTELSTTVRMYTYTGMLALRRGFHTLTGRTGKDPSTLNTTFARVQHYSNSLYAALSINTGRSDVECYLALRGVQVQSSFAALVVSWRQCSCSQGIMTWWGGHAGCAGSSRTVFRKALLKRPFSGPP